MARVIRVERDAWDNAPRSEWTLADYVPEPQMPEPATDAEMDAFYAEMPVSPPPTDAELADMARAAGVDPVDVPF